MKRGWWLGIFIGAIVLIVIASLIIINVVIFSNVEKCENLQCFNSNLASCTKASYLNDAADAAWQYEILGQSNDGCDIKVGVLQIKKGSIKLSSLEGKDMVCSLPIGFVANPKDNLLQCHGILKEEILTIIVNLNHNYVLGNLDKIGEGLENETI